jgi:hypothetical protein
MAEDQGVNGDKWNKEFEALAERIGWVKTIDSDSDLPNSKNKKHGIDAFYEFENGFKSGVKQGIFVEAKNYLVSSFNMNDLNEWVKVLHKKVKNLSLSKEFKDTYSVVKDYGTLRNGLIVLWFEDADGNAEAVRKFEEAKRRVEIPQGRRYPTRLFVLDNKGILRLIDMVCAIERWEMEYKSSLSFYYPSNIKLNTPARKSKILSIEYVFSKFILSRGVTEIEGKATEIDVVYYFGGTTLDNFRHLQEALINYNILEGGKVLQLYVYDYGGNWREFRKIIPSVIRLFDANGGPKTELKSMTKLKSLPDWMLDNR